MSDPTFYNQSDATSEGSEANAIDFAIAQRLAKVNVAMLVKVIAVSAPGMGAITGTLDVQPMVNLTDGAGNAQQHGVVHELVYFRLQGGASAVILDPVAGDIGVAMFCHRDISAVKATGAISNPGSFRRFSLSDGIYFGGVLNGTPTQYVQFLPAGAGINLITPGTVNIVAGSITSMGAWAHTGTLMNNGKNIGSTHEHGGCRLGPATPESPYNR